MVLPEAAVARSVIRTFSCGEKLHGRVNEKRIREGLEREISGFFCVRIIGAKAMEPDQASTDTRRSDAQQGDVVADVDMISGNLAGRLAIGREKSARGKQKECVPFEILAFERSEVESLLVVESALEIPNKKTLVLLRARLRGLVGLI